MTRRDHADRDQFVAQLVREAPTITDQDIAMVLDTARVLQRLAVQDCNVGLTGPQQARRDRLEVALTTVLAPYGIVPDCSGDPRGAVVKLQLPSGRTNDGGQVGWCVPTEV